MRLAFGINNKLTSLCSYLSIEIYSTIVNSIMTAPIFSLQITIITYQLSNKCF